MQSISKFNKGFKFLLCVIDIYIKYVWVIPLKNKKSILNSNSFQENLMANQIKKCVDKGS